MLTKDTRTDFGTRLQWTCCCREFHWSGYRSCSATKASRLRKSTMRPGYVLGRSSLRLMLSAFGNPTPRHLARRTTRITHAERLLALTNTFHRPFGWRRERDSNPRAPFGANGFQDRRFQPLTHPSEPFLSVAYVSERPFVTGYGNIYGNICRVFFRPVSEKFTLNP